ncbi:hypothetical protein MPH_12874 [Macrophomina phaseolina MS6]|uniref:Uncharacterized protein n=1 Tax=Macrophomina phaseolina (strain MS6) TaxID=1126212 RepID=K2RB56_MACPH|nr:hypothetical protein MPH_12874 [Macrophomina phaseolina MS6]
MSRSKKRKRNYSLPGRRKHPRTTHAKLAQLASSGTQQPGFALDHGSANPTINNVVDLTRESEDEAGLKLDAKDNTNSEARRSKKARRGAAVPHRPMPVTNKGASTQHAKDKVPRKNRSIEDLTSLLPKQGLKHNISMAQNSSVIPALPAAMTTAQNDRSTFAAKDRFNTDVAGKSNLDELAEVKFALVMKDLQVMDAKQKLQRVQLEYAQSKALTDAVTTVLRNDRRELRLEVGKLKTRLAKAEADEPWGVHDLYAADDRDKAGESGLRISDTDKENRKLKAENQRLRSENEELLQNLVRFKLTG